MTSDPGATSGAGHLRTGLLLTAVQAGGLLLVLCQEVISARLFGARAQLDGYLEAWIVPATLSTIIGMVLQDTTIPFFAQVRAAEGEAAAWQGAGEAVGLAVGMYGILGIVLLLGSHWVLAFTTRGADAAAGSIAATVFPIGFIVSAMALASATVGGALAASGRFLVVAISSNALLGLPAIVLLVTGRSLAIYALPLGYLLSALGQLSILLFGVRGTGFRPRLPGRVALGRMAGMLRQSAALAVAVIPMQTLALLERHFASRLGTGAVSHLFYASKLLSATVRLVTYSMGAMSLSLMSAYLARGEVERFRRLFRLFFSAGCYLAVAGIACLRVEGHGLIRLALERGAFGAADSATVAAVLDRYSWYLVYGLVFPTVSASLLANRNARGLIVPNVLGLLTYLLVVRWSAPQGVLGLALAYPVAYLVNFCLATGELVRTRVLSIRTVVLPVIRAGGLGLTVYLTCWGAARACERLSVRPSIAIALGLLSAALVATGTLLLLDRTASREVVRLVSRLVVGKRSHAAPAA